MNSITQPETSFWELADGNFFQLKEPVDNHINSIDDPKDKILFLKKLYTLMLKEAIAKNIFGQFLTQNKVIIGAAKNKEGKLEPIQKRIFFDFQVQNSSQGILLVE